MKTSEALKYAKTRLWDGGAGTEEEAGHNFAQARCTQTACSMASSAMRLGHISTLSARLYSDSCQTTSASKTGC